MVRLTLQPVFTNLHDISTNSPSEDLRYMWSAITKSKQSICQGHRLENLSWRLWYASTNGFKNLIDADGKLLPVSDETTTSQKSLNEIESTMGNVENNGHQIPGKGNQLALQHSVSRSEDNSPSDPLKILHSLSSVLEEIRDSVPGNKKTQKSSRKTSIYTQSQVRSGSNLNLPDSVSTLSSSTIDTDHARKEDEATSSIPFIGKKTLVENGASKKASSVGAISFSSSDSSQKEKIPSRAHHSISPQTLDYFSSDSSSSINAKENRKGRYSKRNDWESHHHSTVASGHPGRMSSASASISPPKNQMSQKHDTLHSIIREAVSESDQCPHALPQHHCSHCVPHSIYRYGGYYCTSKRTHVIEGYELDESLYQDDPTDPNQNIPATTFPYDDRQFDIVSRAFSNTSLSKTEKEYNSNGMDHPSSIEQYEKPFVSDDSSVTEETRESMTDLPNSNEFEPLHDSAHPLVPKTSLLSIMLGGKNVSAPSLIDSSSKDTVEKKISSSLSPVLSNRSSVGFHTGNSSGLINRGRLDLSMTSTTDKKNTLKEHGGHFDSRQKLQPPSPQQQQQQPSQHSHLHYHSQQHHPATSNFRTTSPLPVSPPPVDNNLSYGIW